MNSSESEICDVELTLRVLISIDPVAAYTCLFDLIKMHGTVNSTQQWIPSYLEYMTETLNGVHELHTEKRYCYAPIPKRMIGGGNEL